MSFTEIYPCIMEKKRVNVSFTTTLMFHSIFFCVAILKLYPRVFTKFANSLHCIIKCMVESKLDVNFMFVYLHLMWYGESYAGRYCMEQQTIRLGLEWFEHIRATVENHLFFSSIMSHNNTIFPSNRAHHNHASNKMKTFFFLLNKIKTHYNTHAAYHRKLEKKTPIKFQMANEIIKSEQQKSGFFFIHLLMRFFDAVSFANDENDNICRLSTKRKIEFAQMWY